jgi:hypothetical protein
VYRPRQSPTSNRDLHVQTTLGNVDRLPRNLEIDGVFYPPCAYLVADDIVPATGAWASRHDVTKTLSVAGSGTDPTYGNATAIENSAVKYAAAKYHAASDTTWGQITTGDFAISVIFVMPVAPTGKRLLATRTAGGGVDLFLTGTSVSIYLSDGTNTINRTATATITEGSLCHAVIFNDRSDGFYFYQNGAFSNYEATSNVTGDLTFGNLFIGSLLGGSLFDGSVLHMSMWNLPTNPFPGALKNRTYFDKIARERFAIISGTADRNQGRNTFTRATSAYLEKYVPSLYVRRLHQVSAHWPRICEQASGTQRVRAYLSEPQAINLCVQSEDLTTTWTAEELTTISANAHAAPNGLTTADGLVANATDTTHGVSQSLTLPATMHCLSAYVRGGDKTWVELYSTIANVSCYFNIGSGSTGTKGAAVTAASIQTVPYDNNFFRCWIVFTGSADAKSYGVRVAQADTDNTFAGDATTVNAYVWGVQVEAVTEHFPSSYIPTVAAAVTRNKDEFSTNVRLPIVGNIDDLPQSLTIGGSDYQPCAYLVADDIQADGTWASRHDVAKTLAFTGAGTNPTRQWNAVSRANRTVRYWASNTHAAADTTWAQPGTNDAALEATFRLDTTASQTILTTYAANTGILLATNASSQITCQMRDGTGSLVTLTHTTALVAGQWYHVFVGMDRSEKAYMAVNGLIAAGTPSADITGIALTWTSAALIVGTSAPQIAHAAMWSLAGAPWPGAATNQAVITALARARFNQLFRYQSCRLDCDILHPNVNRQAAANLVDAGISANDRMTLGLTAADVLASVGTANGSAQWSMAGSTDIAANVRRKLSVRARLNSASADVDNASEATDAACEVPAGITRVFVGELLDGTIQPACLVGNLRLSRSDR